MVTAVTGTSFTVAPATTSTAMLRALGAQISAAIASAGMVKTTDTGQVDWTAVNWVTGTQTWGYEVWRFNDTLQATKPVFIKIIYRQAFGGTGNAIEMSAQVGTATDGAGTLTSAPNTGTSVTAATQICQMSGPGTVVSPWHIYGDGSSLVIACVIDKWTGVNGTGYGGMLYVERVRHIDGTPLGDAVNCTFVLATLTSSSSQTLMLNNTYPQLGPVSGAWLPALPVAGMPASGVIGANMFTVPWFTGFSPRLGAPSTILIGFYRPDTQAGNTFTCDHYGSARTFVPLAPSVNYAFAMNGAVNVLAPAVRIS